MMITNKTGKRYCEDCEKVTDFATVKYTEDRRPIIQCQNCKAVFEVGNIAAIVEHVEAARKVKDATKNR